jgi:hypothetical protein
MVRIALLAAVLVACQSHGDQAPRPAPKDARAAPQEPPIDASDEPVREPEPPDPGKALADLGAVSAWQAVIDRAQYLARRGQHGVVYGTIGTPVLLPGPPPLSSLSPSPSPADTGAAKPVDGGLVLSPVDGGLVQSPVDGGLVPSPYVWLVDDTEGNGALAIRVLLGRYGDKVKQGDRVALGGAWALDERRRWYWAVDSLTPLPSAPPSDLTDPPSPPGHDIIDGSVPPGARTISVAKDGDAVYFMLTGPRQPVMPGEGWPVADELGDPIFALLNLPGERPSFGGQDMRTADERWQLERGQTYWVRIGKIRRPAPDKPALINARTAPVRVK